MVFMASAVGNMRISLIKPNLIFTEANCPYIDDSKNIVKKYHSSCHTLNKKRQVLVNS